MRKISKIYKKLGIDFSFPIRIKDCRGNDTYLEYEDGYWCKWEYDNKGNGTSIEDSDGYQCRWEHDNNGNVTYYTDGSYWSKREYDDNSRETYFENSYGEKNGTPRSQSCDSKVIVLDGKKYQLKEL